MQRLLYVLIIFATSTSWAFAQQSTITVVQLTNGSIAKGKMLTSKSSDRVKVETPDGSIIFFTKNAISEVSKENYQPSSTPGEVKNTLYLQNGSIINGRITKIKDSDRMKITTPSGSIIYFTEKSVLDITRPDTELESVASSPTRQRAQSSRNEPTRVEPTAQRQTQAKTDPRTEAVKYDNEIPGEPSTLSGYRGFIDLGYTVKMGEISTSRLDFSTSHGYEINSRFFIGLGVGVNIYSDGLYYNPSAPAKALDVDTVNMSIAIPIFADFRVNFLDKGSIIPFAGLKVGYSMGFFDSEFKKTEGTETRERTETKLEGVGLYLQPSVGAKVKLGTKMALNLSIGYAFQSFDHYYQMPDDNVTVYKKMKNNGGVNIRLGFEF